MGNTRYFNYKFGDLPSVGIWLSQNDKKGVLIISCISVFQSTMDLLKEINIYHNKDRSNNKSIFEYFPPKNYKKFSRFVLREKWRFGSLVLWSINLEQILSKDFKDKLNLYKNLTTKKTNDIDNNLVKRKDEIRPIKFYRDKVFGHTAYGYPKNDNLTMQQTSLDIFGTQNVSIIKKEIVFGGITSVVGGKKIPPPGFSSFSFKDLVIYLNKHFIEWYKMYYEILTIINNTSDQQFHKYYKSHGCKIHKITRKEDFSLDSL